MADSVQIAVFEGGNLAVQATGEKTKEAVLALPLARLLVKVVRVGEDGRADPEAVALPILQAQNPYPDDELTVSCEAMREMPSGLVVLAAALPESTADDIGEALDAAKLNITRIDALALGTLRRAVPGIVAGGPAAGADARRMVLIREADDIAMFVLDGDMPVAVRAVADESGLRREAMLSLLEAEDFNGAKDLAEVVAIGWPAMPADPQPDSGAVSAVDEAVSAMAAFAPVRRLEDVKPEDAVAGVAERSLEAESLNALPASWRAMLEETRFKAKFTRYLAVALGIWALAMGVLFGVPLAYGFMTDHQKALSREHARRYNEVKEMREKVRLVQKYSDHARGALEILKAVSDRLPEGVELSNWNFKREDGVRFSGEAADAASVYQLKDALLEMAGGEEGEEDKVFADVILTGPSAVRGGRQKFDIDCRYETEDER